VVQETSKNVSNGVIVVKYRRDFLGTERTSFLSGPHVKMTLFFPSQSSSSFAASFHLINQERVLFFGLAVFEVGSDV